MVEKKELISDPHLLILTLLSCVEIDCLIILLKQTSMILSLPPLWASNMAYAPDHDPILVNIVCAIGSVM